MSLTVGHAKPTGRLQLEVTRGTRRSQLTFRRFAADALPRPGLDKGVAAWRTRNLPNLLRGALRVAAAKVFRVPTHYGVLYLVKTTGDGRRIDLGLASMRVVTDAGVAKIVALLNGSDAATALAFKYHGFGTGTTAEAAGQTALVTELTTEYATDSTRPTGSQTNNGANIYRTVATLAPDSGGVIAITEHGVFSANAAGTLLDRTKFAAVNLDSGNADTLAVTYDLTLSSGG